MRYTFTILLVLLLGITSQAFNYTDSLQDKALVQQAVKKLLLQEEQNRANEKKGLASLNNYVINIDTENWIEEQGSSEKILSSDDFKRMSQNLQAFNSRKDALRFYVIVINDYVVKFKTVIDTTLVGDTFKWNDLQKYTQQQNTVRNIWSKTGALLNDISEALKSKGFSDRMIYFYSRLKVAEYDGKTHSYKFDRLNFYGENIEPLGEDIRKRAKSVPKDAVKNVDQAIINIINGAKAVIDGEDNAATVDCSQNIETIAANTKSVRDKEYEKQVADFATLIDQPTTAQQKGSRYVIIDKPENFSSDDLFIQEVLPDKVAMLAQSGMSDYKLYVVFKEIKFVLPSSDWEAFAASIAAKSKVAKESNAIIMVVPYYPMVCVGSNWLGMTVGKGTAVIMPAVYTTSNLKTGMNSALSIAGNSWKSTFNQAFKSIPKVHNVYAYLFLWNGDFIQHEVNKQKNATGYENFNDIVINDDGRYEELKKAETFLTGANIDSDVLQEQNATTDEYVNGALSAYFTMVETAMSGEQLVKVRVADEVKQSKITAESATTYARWLWTRKTDRASHFNLPNTVPGDNFFYGGINVVTAQEFMRVLDAASFASSFVGLDFIFDSWQAYYAYDKGFYMDAAIASTAVVVTAVTAAELKVVVKGLRRAEFALVKTLYNKKLIVTALSRDRVYASFIPIVGKLNLENILSSGVVSAIQNKQTFLSAVGYARKAEYQSLVQAFEKAVNESDAFKQLINSNPSAVDVFFKYSKQKPAASVDEVLELATITKDLSKTQLNNFIEDFGGAAFSEAVKKNPKLVEGWNVLDNAGEKTVRKDITELENVTNHLDEIEKAGGYKAWKLSKGLASYPNLRSYLSDSRIKQYLTNEQIRDLENILREAHPDVLKYINDMDVYDFSEMARGYKDLVNVGKSSTLIKAVKSSDAFIGKYGWLTYWKLTPDIKYSLATIDELRNAGKLYPTGNATDIQLGSLQAFTKKGDFINIPMRYNKSYLGEYAEKGYNNVLLCLDELRKVDGRVFKGRVFSGKTFQRSSFEKEFVNGTGKLHDYPSFISTSKSQSVAEGFVELTKQWAKGDDNVAVIQRIISKDGVYIDDLSDWGSNLGKTRHGDADIAIQIQEEVVLNPGNLRQVSEPIPIMENGVHQKIHGLEAYYIDFTQL